MWPNPPNSVNLVIFTEKILNGKLPKIFQSKAFERSISVIKKYALFNLTFSTTFSLLHFYLTLRLLNEMFRNQVYKYEVNLRIQSEYRKIRSRNNSVFGHFSCRAHMTYCPYSFSRTFISTYAVFISDITWRHTCLFWNFC